MATRQASRRTGAEAGLARRRPASEIGPPDRPAQAKRNHDIREQILAPGVLSLVGGVAVHDGRGRVSVGGPTLPE